MKTKTIFIVAFAIFFSNCKKEIDNEKLPDIVIENIAIGQHYSNYNGLNYPDYYFTCIVISPENVVLFKTNSIDRDVVVQNSQFYESDDEIWDSNDRLISQIEFKPGAVSKDEVTKAYLICVVDCNNSIDESDENNNVRAFKVN